MTTSDAIALGSMIAALTAACAGLLRGDRARAERPEHPSHERRLDALTEALRDLASVLRDAVAVAGSKQQLTETIEQLLHRNDHPRGSKE